ncbi:hypothetical protein GLX27_002094 [Malassezia furfur]|uniref:Uncharacterized protein n=1 Tax=Malassezia furfur TaxID=55194 RepID=A0ABY8EPM4_MALFU|nr:hypothetical protein GLX27_002094 [Malassezia furfur]
MLQFSLFWTRWDDGGVFPQHQRARPSKCLGTQRGGHGGQWYARLRRRCVRVCFCCRIPVCIQDTSLAADEHEARLAGGGRTSVRESHPSSLSARATPAA